MLGITHYFMNGTDLFDLFIIGVILLCLIIGVILLVLSVWMIVTEIRDWRKGRGKK